MISAFLANVAERGFMHLASGSHRLRGTTRDFHREQGSKGTIRGPPADYFRLDASRSRRD